MYISLLTDPSTHPSRHSCVKVKIPVKTTFSLLVVFVFSHLFVFNKLLYLTSKYKPKFYKEGRGHVFRIFAFQ
jgi:hypothetical protein